MRFAGRAVGWSAGLVAVLCAVVTTSAGIGPVWIPPAVVGKVLLNAVVVPTGISLSGPAVDVTTAHVFAYAVSDLQRQIVMQVRLPRILLGAVVGFSLAAAGTVMQGIFRNPMADPSIIGVSSGAAVGAVGFIVAPVVIPFGLGLRGAAFAGALVAAFGVYLIATRNGHTPVATLLLAGVAIQTFLGAVVSFLLLHSGESIRRALFWLMGHLKGASWPEVTTSALLVAVPFVVLLAYARDLNVMLLGEEDAQSLGIEVERTKRVLLALSAVITAAGVAVAGIVGFVGLIVPHVMRLLVGPDHRILLPTAALAGASFLVATDTLARSGSAEVPVGIVTAVLGAPFFLYLLRKREVHEL
ncbi:cobalamin ABC transporter permease BtuC [Haloarcula sp. CBA1130]|uniref:vitamin B12 ABC transporter permease BtuC n=1 Tax=unclassified Haloarcula TaxID=2624677 RepID=UPI001244DF97|nr:MULTISPECIES: vitamin B12 ABC transporter permease BtuC [unclassified Haloarcula]KAA9398885.1 cobalamin ABC transporter permease BtuC [Haloarcula sp. CBA1129]KAA9403399.1 cobalamin ABC transporter permease BtuC [Haloarcula sp. CBA1130]